MKKFLLFLFFILFLLGGGFLFWKRSAGNSISLSEHIVKLEPKAPIQVAPLYVKKFTELLDKKIVAEVQARRIGEQIYCAIQSLKQEYKNLAIPGKLLECGDFSSPGQVLSGLERLNFFKEIRISPGFDLNDCRKVLRNYVKTVQEYDSFIKNFSKGGQL